MHVHLSSIKTPQYGSSLNTQHLFHLLLLLLLFTNEEGVAKYVGVVNQNWCKVVTNFFACLVDQLMHFNPSLQFGLIKKDLGTWVRFHFVFCRSKIRSLLYSGHTRKLLSSDDSGKVAVWDMSIERQETAEWAASSACEKCGIPFFWNVKEMWAQKTVGVRQVCILWVWRS